MTLTDAINKAVMREMAARHAFIESECATAMMLQDYDKLPNLCVVERPGCPPAVASMIGREMTDAD